MQLTLRRIVTTAIGLIERDGASALSMSRLATELGCGLMALYHHVPSTSAVLDEIAAETWRGLSQPQPADAWPDRVAAQAGAVWRAAAARPWCAMLLAAEPGRAAAAARPAEQALAALHEAGFARPEATRIVRVLAAYLLGMLLLQPGSAAGPDARDDQARVTPRLRQADFPHLTAALAAPPAADPDADFGFGLGLLLTAISARRPPGRPAQPSGPAPPGDPAPQQAFDRPAAR